MVLGHLVFGLAEALVTGLVLRHLQRTGADLHSLAGSGR